MIGPLARRSGASDELEAGSSASFESQMTTQIFPELAESARPAIRRRRALSVTSTYPSADKPVKRRRIDTSNHPNLEASSLHSNQHPLSGIADAAEAMRLTQAGEASEPQGTQSSSSSDVGNGAAAGATTGTYTSPSAFIASMDDPLVNVKNGHVKALSNGSTNGSLTNGSLSPRIETLAEPYARHAKAVARVFPPGTTLYPDSMTDREEFVRLLLQTLKDVGYLETANVLEQESGYSYETAHVAAFRNAVMNGKWDLVENGLVVLGVRDDDSLRAARFMISQQKYLEYLEANKRAEALLTLRQEIAPLDIEQGRLHNLSSLIMASGPEELRRQAHWDGSNGSSRQRLLSHLQQLVPSSAMVPSRRLDTLLQQAREHQIQMCNYHIGSQTHSLYHDHSCSRKQFPSMNTHILEGHRDEVWQLQWSHRGDKLASSSKDSTVIIWKIARIEATRELDCTLQHVLRDHSFHINAISWSPDDSYLLSSAEHEIKLWHAETGACLKTINQQHSQTVNGLCWLADSSGFVTGGMDRRIIQWDIKGNFVLQWPQLDIRILELAITPNGRRLVAIGQLAQPISISNEHTPSAHSLATTLQASAGVHAPTVSGNENRTSVDIERRIVVYDLETRQEIWWQSVWGELQSVKISEDSRFALINHQQGDVALWDLVEERLIQRYVGRPRGMCVVRSCFGGIDGGLILSGSEDGHVYVWNRRTGTLFEMLSGHEPGGVNSVDWCPGESALFASCGDDGTIRLWGPEPELTADSNMVEQPGPIVHDASERETQNGKQLVGGLRTNDGYLLGASPSRMKEASTR